MTQEQRTLRRQEQKIKNRLYNIALEDHEHSTHYGFSNLHELTQLNFHKKHSDVPQLSDWNSNFNLPKKHQGSHEHSGPFTPEKEDSKRFTFFSSTRYQSSLLSPRSKKERLELSPIVVRFNAKMLSQNLQRSRQKLLKKLKEDPYLTHYQSLNLLYEKKKRQEESKGARQIERHQIKFQGEEAQPIQYKTERMSGLLKLIKREPPYRIRPKKIANPENLTTTRLC